MSEDPQLLPSWRPGPVRDAVTGFLDAAMEVAPRDRVACLDNDGTLWCERPNYVQLDFFIDALRARTAEDPAVASTPEFAALLSGDKAAMGELGLARIAMALVGLFEGMTPEESRGLLEFLYAHASSPEFVYRHSWRDGDVVMWDNRCLLHYAVHDHGDATRLMHRVTVVDPHDERAAA